MAPQAADVSFLEGESAGEKVLEREVEGLGIRGFDVVVHAPVDGEAFGRRAEGECLGGREGRQRNVGQVVRAGKARIVLVAILVGRVGDAGSEAVGANIVKGVDEGLAVVVVIHTGAGTDGGSGIGGVNHADARGEVLFLLGPVCGRVVGVAGGGEGDDGLVHLAMLGRGFTLLVPFIGIDGGRNFLTVGFVGSLEQGVAHAEGYGEVGAGVPGVLDIALDLVGVEVFGDGSAFGERRSRGSAGDCVVVDVGELGDDAHEIGPVLAPRVGKALGHVGGDGQILGVCVRVVGLGVIERAGVAAVVVGDGAPVAAKGKGVGALVPGESVDDVVDRDVEQGASGLCGGLG